MQNTQAELSLIVDSIPGLVSAKNATGELQLVNRQFVEYLGKPLEELNDWATSEVVHPEDRCRLVAASKHSIETGESKETEFRMLRADGSYRWFQNRSLPLRDREGRITRWYTLVTDIEDRKQAEDNLRIAFEEIKKLRDQLHQENLALKEEIDQASMFEEIVGCSDALRRVLVQVEKVAAPDRLLRCCVLKHLKGWSFRALERELRSNLIYRRFTHFDAEGTPDYTSFSRLFALLSPALTQQIHQRVVGVAREQGVAHGRKLRTDTTAVETNVHFPTDSTLLGDGIRVLSCCLKRMAA